MFKIIWSKKAEKFLFNVNRVLAKRIIKKIEKLSKNPFLNSRKLRGFDYYRYRIGDYRVIFDIDIKNKTIIILFLDHRKNIYREFK